MIAVPKQTTPSGGLTPTEGLTTGGLISNG